MIKQSSIPNYSSSWTLFSKFAILKDVQNSEDRKYRLNIIDLQLNDSLNQKRNTQKKLSVRNKDVDDVIFSNDTIKHENNTRDMSYDDQSINEDMDIPQRINVEPSFIGGSADLSTDTIAAFCQFLEASLKQMNTDQSDDLIENISMMLFRKKRENKLSDSKTTEFSLNNA